MHEYPLIKGVVRSLLARLEEMGGSRPGPGLEVVLRVGALEVHSEAAARQVYGALVKGTLLENSRLRLILEAPTIACSRCGFRGALPENAWESATGPYPAPCPACGASCAPSGGRGIKSLELTWK